MGNTYVYVNILVQSTLVISKSKGLSEILRDIRTSTYQICRTEDKIFRTTTFHKRLCNLTPEVRDILKILLKREEIRNNFSSFPQYFATFGFISTLETGTRFSLRDTRLFEINEEVEITRVDCTSFIIPTFLCYFVHYSVRHTFPHKQDISESI